MVKTQNKMKDNEEESNILYGYSIGTAATRAETINKLKYAGYITPKGKSLLITAKGTKLIETFPIRELLDTDYTGKLEKNYMIWKRENLKKKIF